jgi:hypothetical protein
MKQSLNYSNFSIDSAQRAKMEDDLLLHSIFSFLTTPATKVQRAEALKDIEALLTPPAATTPNKT